MSGLIFVAAFHGVLSAGTSVEANITDESSHEHDLNALVDALSELRINGSWHSKREILLYLNGFVGSIQWLIADALITGTSAQYKGEIRGFHSMLKEHVAKWHIHSLPPPHRRSMDQNVTEDD